MKPNWKQIGESKVVAFLLLVCGLGLGFILGFITAMKLVSLNMGFHDGKKQYEVRELL